MNKLILVFLAVCLIGAHAFVKRDAPAAATNDNALDTVKKQVEDLISKAQESLKPEVLQKVFTDISNSVNNAISNVQNSLKATEKPQ